MHKALLGMIVFGVVIGLAWPTDKAASGAANSDAVAKAETDSEVFGSDAPRETHLSRRDNGHFYVKAAVNGTLVEFVVDTGASTVALTEDDAQRVGLDFSPAEFEIVGEGASGPVRGKTVTLDSVSIEGKKVRDVNGAILEGGSISLLGQSYLSRISSVHMSGETMTLR